MNRLYVVYLDACDEGYNFFLEQEIPKISRKRHWYFQFFLMQEIKDKVIMDERYQGVTGDFCDGEYLQIRDSAEKMAKGDSGNKEIGMRI